MVLYREILGDVLDNLPPPVRDLHDSAERRTWVGEVQVTPGVWWLRPFAKAFGFPTQGGTGPITVTFTPDGDGEVWERDFDGHRLTSHQSYAAPDHMVERFGRAAVTVRFEPRADRLHLIPVSGRAFGVPIPRYVLPKGTSFETADNDRFRFDVEAILPFGRLVRYQGWLLPGETLG